MAHSDSTAAQIRGVDLGSSESRRCTLIEHHVEAYSRTTPSATAVIATPIAVIRAAETTGR
jgi:hypothetical protein